MSMGETLKEIRVNRGYSQQEAAESIGISRYLISKYENDTCIPRGKTLLSIAKFYNVDIDYLLSGNDNDTNLIDFYANILDPTSKSKINPCVLGRDAQYFAILSDFENINGINKNDLLVFARSGAEISEKLVLVSYLSTEVLFGFLWANNGVKMLSVKTDQPPIDISNEKEYQILGYLVKSVRDFGRRND